MGTGAALGAVNGWICEKWKLPSFIVTLGMLNVASGLARVVSDNSTITGLPQPFVDFGNLIFWGIFPSIFLIAIVVVLIGWFVLRYTVFGRFVFEWFRIVVVVVGRGDAGKHAGEAAS